MTTNQIQRTVRRLESFLNGVETRVNEKRTHADKLEGEANSLGTQMKRATARVTQVAADDPNAETAAEQIARRYRDLQQQKRNEAQEERNEIDQLVREKSSAEQILTELKKLEGYLRDFENNAQRWMGQAKQVIN